MIQDLKYFFSSLIEPPNFPFWELYVLFIMLLFISIIFISIKPSMLQTITQGSSII